MCKHACLSIIILEIRDFTQYTQFIERWQYQPVVFLRRFNIYHIMMINDMQARNINWVKIGLS